MAETADQGHHKQLTSSLRILLSNLIDYAGLYPPANLNMEGALRRYASHRASENNWALGRFVVSVDKLEQFEESIQALPHRAGEEDAWRLTAIAAGPDLEPELEKVALFNRRREKAGELGFAARIDAIEWKPGGEGEIDGIKDLPPVSISIYCEIGIENLEIKLIDAIVRAGVRAKVRTGGVTTDKFPSSAQLAAFLVVCAERNVGFKATAGLHHPLRAIHPLTYEPNSPRELMHGFLNVFAAAAFARRKLPASEIAALLEEQSLRDLELAHDGLRWRSHKLENQQLLDARQNFALSFGSCSFEEPIIDLRTLGLL